MEVYTQKLSVSDLESEELEALTVNRPADFRQRLN